MNEHYKINNIYKKVPKKLFFLHQNQVIFLFAKMCYTLTFYLFKKLIFFLNFWFD